ncbi:hypothetical protein DFH09DRAFT_1439991 [Mycena vulgaris]|nr:hypothetical protein DFH09DRAFT_1439991 [Mycena vulgaris]
MDIEKAGIKAGGRVAVASLKARIWGTWRELRAIGRANGGRLELHSGWKVSQYKTEGRGEFGTANVDVLEPSKLAPRDVRSAGDDATVARRRVVSRGKQLARRLSSKYCFVSSGFGRRAEENVRGSESLCAIPLIDVIDHKIQFSGLEPSWKKLRRKMTSGCQGAGASGQSLPQQESRCDLSHSRGSRPVKPGRRAGSKWVQMSQNGFGAARRTSFLISNVLFGTTIYQIARKKSLPPPIIRVIPGVAREPETICEIDDPENPHVRCKVEGCETKWAGHTTLAFIRGRVAVGKDGKVGDNGDDRGLEDV